MNEEKKIHIINIQQKIDNALHLRYGLSKREIP